MIVTDRARHSSGLVADDSSKTNAADISGATNAAYTIPADGTLNGKHLFVKVTTTDSKGGTTVTEKTMGAIANVDDLPTGADATLTATEDTALVLTAANFGYRTRMVTLLVMLR